MNIYYIVEIYFAARLINHHTRLYTDSELEIDLLEWLESQVIIGLKKADY